MNIHMVMYKSKYSIIGLLVLTRYQQTRNRWKE